jgi:hypothetical protein
MRCPSFRDTCLVQFPLSGFEVNGRQHAVVGVLAFGLAEDLDVVEHAPPCFVACWIGPASDLLAFQQLEEAIGHSVRRLRIIPRIIRPAGTDALELVTSQFLRQLAIAIDLAAVGPCLPDQRGLARILLRTVAQRLSCCPVPSNTIRTAGSRTSGEYLFAVSVMLLHPPHGMEPPANPVRFSTLSIQCPV